MRFFTCFLVFVALFQFISCDRLQSWVGTEQQKQHTFFTKIAKMQGQYKANIKKERGIMAGGEAKGVLNMSLALSDSPEAGFVIRIENEKRPSEDFLCTHFINVGVDMEKKVLLGDKQNAFPFPKEIQLVDDKLNDIEVQEIRHILLDEEGLFSEVILGNLGSTKTVLSIDWGSLIPVSKDINFDKLYDSCFPVVDEGLENVDEITQEETERSILNFLRRIFLQEDFPQEIEQEDPPTPTNT